MRRIEDQIQRAVLEHLKIRGQPGILVWHTPSGMYAGGRRTKTGAAVQASILKGLGWRAGISDLLILYNGKLFGLELKAPGNRSTPAQLAWRSAMNAAGGFAAEAVGIDAALACLETWGLLRGHTA